MSLDLPKISPDSIARPALERWLDRHAQVPVRVVAAPPASGKTTAVALWARARLDEVAWVTVAPGASEHDLCDALLRALAPPPGVDLRRALATSTKRQIVIDAADAGDLEARAFLSRLYAEGPPQTTFVYLTRSANGLDLLRGFTTGIAVGFENSLLRFDQTQVEVLCIFHEVPSTAAERARLIEATGGWPLAVAGAIRYAAGIGAPLEGALARWMESSRRVVTRLVEDALASAPPAAADLFAQVVDGGVPDAPLDELVAAGLFVDEVEGGWRINPVIRALGAGGRRVAPGPAVVHMFGRFRITIGDEEIEFVRRRDRQILQYLALQPDGAATRSALVAVFWPDSDPQLAGQALRTACSTIRRSFAKHVGREAVDSYIRSEGPVLRLRLDNVQSTVDRFRSHVDLASIADEDGRSDAAFAHWSAAVRLYAAPLLSGEPPTGWIETAQREFENIAAIAKLRLHDLDEADRTEDEERSA